ncbi:MAG: transposase [Nitrososphaerota archaeon]|nr:transposase [Nitrososphaerota archaeon]MDG6978491.1 transposase [Nitrososphaerota archaeon]
MAELPDWVRRQKVKGTEVRRMAGGTYYLYKVTSVWDPAKGRARKITEGFLGRITPEGLVKPKRERILDGLKEISVKEFGASSFVLQFCPDIIDLVRRHYPDYWREVTVLSIVRLFHSSPLKNVIHHYGSSHLSDAISGAEVSPRSLSMMLHSIGMRRERMVEFMKNFVGNGEEEHAVIDLTHFFSLSEGVITATLGHNSDEEYVPQVNFVLILSLGKRMHPSFFRLVPGSINDVSTIPATIREAGVTRAVVIGDKGFYSKRNASFLEENGLEYVLPLKRSNSLIDYSPLSRGTRKRMDGHFLFEKRVIWYSEGAEEEEGTHVILFLDNSLRTEEERDIISNVDGGGRLTMRDYYDRQRSMGTISVATNTQFRPQKVFELLKSRVNVEQVFDTMKNTLNADRTYMRDDAHLQGWMLVNFVSLLMYYKVYGLLLSKDMLERNSPKDVLLHLSRVYKLRIGGGWNLSEVPKASRLLAKQLGVELHIT